MTDKAYKAKTWLNRLVDLHEELRRTGQTIADIESRINNAVSNYDNSGSGQTDLIVRQQQKEDSLIDYALKREEYDNKYFEYSRQEMITVRVILQMKDKRNAAILLEKHINHKSIKQIANSGRFKLKEAQLYSLYKKSLDELASLLETEEPTAIREVDNFIREYHEAHTA